MKKNLLRIATRKSKLALWQANFIKHQLQLLHPQLTIELLGITTSGDKNLNTPLNSIGGKGLFVKELEQAILAGEADIAVHSMKDVPMELPAELTIAAICKRDDPRDVFVSQQFASLEALPREAVIGTSSLRRLCQLRALRSDLLIKPLRGNIDTRLEHLAQGSFDAIILAAAGLERLNLATHIKEYFAVSQFLPAVGQGALGIECKKNDPTTLEFITSLNDLNTQLCVTAERALNAYLDGGCQVPIAAYAILENNQINLHGLVGSLDGQILLRAQINGSPQDAAKLGISAAKQLITLGAESLLSACKNSGDGFAV